MLRTNGQRRKGEAKLCRIIQRSGQAYKNHSVADPVEFWEGDKLGHSRVLAAVLTW